MTADLLISIVLKETLNLSEGKRVYRNDPEGTTIDHENLNRYSIGPIFSGSLGRRKKAVKGAMLAKGLFAFPSRAAAGIYAVPRDVKRVAHLDVHGRKHIMFHIRDKERIENHRSVESSFDSGSFRKLASGERVSRKPGPALKTRKINDPIKHLTSMGWHVGFTKDLNGHLQSLKKSYKETGHVQHISAENMADQWEKK